MKHLLWIPVFFLTASVWGGCKHADSKGNNPPDDTTKTTAVTHVPSMEYLTFDVNNLPAGVTGTGQIVDGKHWKDADGEFYLILHEGELEATTEAVNEYVEAGSKSVYATCFKIENGKATQAWQHINGVKDCPLDITCAFVKDAVVVTDLDGDNRSEVSFVYRTACRGDISPPDMHLVLCHKGKEYVIEGQGVMSGAMFGMDEDFGGEIYKTTIPANFADFANTEWDKFKKEAM